jgi:hypothetical protein
MSSSAATDEDPSVDEIRCVARGIATAVAPAGGLDPVQVSLLGAVTEALTDVRVDFDDLEPLSPDELATVLEDHDVGSRRRIIHRMVLGELILRPLPPEVAQRVAHYAEALGVEDQFVRVARRYAQGAFGLAWVDLHRSGFAEHWESARMDQLRTSVTPPDQLSAGEPDPELAECWRAFEHLPTGTLGRSVWEMYHGRGFPLPGSVDGASAFLAQHDFVHVMADYGTNLDGELEVFALIGRADPDPKGFAWLATLVGLFETGYVADAGFFTGDLRERHLDSHEMHVRIADALRRGRASCETLGVDLLEVDYHALADRTVEEVRAELGIVDKSPDALACGSNGVFDLQGMSRLQQEHAASLSAGS